MNTKIEEFIGTEMGRLLDAGLPTAHATVNKIQDLCEVENPPPCGTVQKPGKGKGGRGN